MAIFSDNDRQLPWWALTDARRGLPVPADGGAGAGRPADTLDDGGAPLSELVAGVTRVVTAGVEDGRDGTGDDLTILLVVVGPTLTHCAHKQKYPDIYEQHTTAQGCR